MSLENTCLFVDPPDDALYASQPVEATDYTFGVPQHSAQVEHFVCIVILSASIINFNALLISCDDNPICPICVNQTHVLPCFRGCGVRHCSNFRFKAMAGN
jgi:hypothetical protein